MKKLTMLLAFAMLLAFCCTAMADTVSVAVVYSDTVDDKGWCQSMDIGIKNAIAKGYEIDYTPVESVAIPDAPNTLGQLAGGAPVNLERAMRPSDRFGGHIVSGHVDGTGTVDSITADARALRWRFAAPADLLRYVAKKGSICVDGVSLTVNAVDDAGFEVALIPHTVAHTAFAHTVVGDAVNLEIDVIARYAERLLGAGEKA